MDIDYIKNELSVFKTVVLNESTHKYSWVSKTGESMRNRTSMTTLLHQYSQPFDQDKEAEKYAKKYNLVKEDVIQEWSRISKEATTKGTAIHNYLEYLFNNVPEPYMYNVEEVIKIFGVDIIAPKWEKLTQMANKFHDMAINFLIPIACELKIADDETGIAGAIDMLCLHKQSGQLVILDYKSGKEIRRENIYNQWMLEPLNHLPDINYIHYSLQLSGYQYILEKNTNLKLRNTHFIVWVYEENDNVEIIPTLDLYKEAAYMIEHA